MWWRPASSSNSVLGRDEPAMLKAAPERHLYWSRSQTSRCGCVRSHSPPFSLVCSILDVRRDVPLDPGRRSQRPRPRAFRLPSMLTSEKMASTVVCSRRQMASSGSAASMTSKPLSRRKKAVVFRSRISAPTTRKVRLARWSPAVPLVSVMHSPGALISPSNARQAALGEQPFGERRRGIKRDKLLLLLQKLRLLLLLQMLPRNSFIAE
jgi:hypothetical protein